MRKRMSKKGALELSVNTIVIVVIGITLLVLGLVFVRGIFERLGGLGGSAFQKAEQELQQMQSGDTKINFPSTIEVKKGKSIVEELRVCNTDGAMAGGSKLYIMLDDAYTGLSVSCLGTGIGTSYVNLGTLSIDAQECLPFPILIESTPSTAIETTKQPFLTIVVGTSTTSGIYHRMGTVIDVI